MEILDLRLLGSRDLDPLLEEEKLVWMESLRWDYSSTAGMVSRYLDARSLIGYAAIEQSRVIGYSFYIYENQKGLVGDAFVSREFRNGARERELLTHLLESLLSTQGIRRVEAQLIQLDAPGVDELFCSQGFQSFSRTFLQLDLRAPAPALEAVPQGDVHVQRWSARWFHQAAQLITRAYRNHVDSAISDQYVSLAGATRFLENVVQYPGCGTFYGDASYVAISAPGNAPCGLMLTSVVSEHVAHITQLCIAPEFRGAGIGRRLLDKGLQTLRERGFELVTLTVTAENQRARRLYESAGFSRLAGFSAYAWDAPVAAAVSEPKAALRSRS